MKSYKSFQIFKIAFIIAILLFLNSFVVNSEKILQQNQIDEISNLTDLINNESDYQYTSNTQNKENDTLQTNTNNSTINNASNDEQQVNNSININNTDSQNSKKSQVATNNTINSLNITQQEVQKQKLQSQKKNQLSKGKQNTQNQTSQKVNNNQPVVKKQSSSSKQEQTNQTIYPNQKYFLYQSNYLNIQINNLIYEEISVFHQKLYENRNTSFINNINNIIFNSTKAYDKKKKNQNITIAQQISSIFTNHAAQKIYLKTKNTKMIFSLNKPQKFDISMLFVDEGVFVHTPKQFQKDIYISNQEDDIWKQSSIISLIYPELQNKKIKEAFYINGEIIILVDEQLFIVFYNEKQPNKSSLQKTNITNVKDFEYSHQNYQCMILIGKILKHINIQKIIKDSNFSFLKIINGISDIFYNIQSFAMYQNHFLAIHIDYKNTSNKVLLRKNIGNGQPEQLIIKCHQNENQYLQFIKIMNKNNIIILQGFYQSNKDKIIRKYFYQGFQIDIQGIKDDNLTQVFLISHIQDKKTVKVGLFLKDILQIKEFIYLPSMIKYKYQNQSTLNGIQIQYEFYSHQDGKLRNQNQKNSNMVQLDLNDGKTLEEIFSSMNKEEKINETFSNSSTVQKSQKSQKNQKNQKKQKIKVQQNQNKNENKNKTIVQQEKLQKNLTKQQSQKKTNNNQQQQQKKKSMQQKQQIKKEVSKQKQQVSQKKDKNLDKNDQKTSIKQTKTDKSQVDTQNKNEQFFINGLIVILILAILALIYLWKKKNRGSNNNGRQRWEEYNPDTSNALEI